MTYSPSIMRSGGNLRDMGKHPEERALVFQTYRFVLVGLLNTIVGFSVFYILLSLLHVNYSVSLIISHFIGVIHSYLWNKNWTFRVKKNSSAIVIKFFVLYAAIFVINYIILVLLVEVVGYNKLLAQVISLLLTTIISFVGQRFWSFKTIKVESES